MFVIVITPIYVTTTISDKRLNKRTKVKDEHTIFINII